MAEAQQAKTEENVVATAEPVPAEPPTAAAAAATDDSPVAVSSAAAVKIDEDLPMATEVFLACQVEGVSYTSVAAGPYASYFVRSDGSVDRTLYKGKISCTLSPAQDGARYIQASAGEYATYLLRDDGSVDRLKSSTSVETMNPPPGKKYLAVTSGEYASYFLVDDGSVVRTTGGGKIAATITPPEGVKYIAVSAGTHASYFLRDDGSVDRTKGKGVICQTLAPPEDSTFKYVGVAAGEFNTYLVRDDGWIDRTKGYGKIHHSFEPPANTKYISVSDMFAITTQHSQYVHKDSPWQMYFVRADGAVDRIVRFKTNAIERTINPPPGMQYIAASSGLHNSYFLRSDGVVGRVSCGKVKRSLLASTKSEENEDGSSGGCSVM